ncbi:MAG: 2-oxoacid:acceptor oxidoreductase subunit alpha [Pseudomonadota bacterium]
MSAPSLSITIAGEAGQGLVTVGDLLIKSLVRSGYFIVVVQDYMSRVRGGHNTFSILTGPEPLQSPVERIDLLLALNQDGVDLHRSKLAEDGLIAGDRKLDLPDRGALPIPLDELSEGRFSNIALLGVACAALGLNQEVPAEALDKAFGKKHPETAQKNAAALAKAYEWQRGKTPEKLKLPPPYLKAKRLIMNGAEAMALGAMAGGVKFCAFYPMTPSTTIALNLAARAQKLGLVVEQAEDEIAAVNMALGASFAGAPSLVTTSGGGFALMTEGVSLSGMIETPLVIALVQRPGPATGLPTRTEQADLDLALYSGHGEFPRAILAPGDVEECFHLSRHAFHLAEKWQGPVFILGDQFLADSYRAVEPFNLSELPPVDPAAAHAAPVTTPYERYALTDNGVSPRLLPGFSEHLVVADSDEHTPDGHLTEDLAVRVQMNEKRLRKMAGLQAEAIPPQFFGDENPDLLLVCWGSSKGPVWEAAADLRSRGRKIGALHFSQVWPLAPDAFLPYLESAAQVAAVEGNARGQLAGLIRRETGFFIPRLISRCDGLPLTPDYILRQLAG